MATKQPAELTYLDLTVMNSGNSLRVTVPADVTREAGVEKGDKVSAKYDREDGTLTFFLN